jgi:ribonuclease HI
MKLKDLFNKDSICIFTDSSFKNESKEKSIAIGTTAPAVCIYNGTELISQDFSILHNSTTQQGELYAILIGVMKSYLYRDFKHIRLFSDSQVSIFGIRDRIFKWIRETNEGKSILGENGSIKNQDYIMDIVYYILSNNILIELYHVKGHVKRSYDSIVHAKKVFQSSNNINEFIDDALIYMISDANNTVDNYSTQMLNKNMYNPAYSTIGLTNGISIGYSPFDTKTYYELIKGGG